MGRLATKLVDFLTKRKALFFVLLTLSVIILATGASRIRISEDIFSALPEGQAFRQLNALVESRNLVNQVIFSIEADAEGDADPQELVTAYAEALKNDAGGLLTDIRATRPDVEQKVYTYFYTHFPYLATDRDYQRMESRTATDSIRRSVAASFAAVTSPGSPFLRDIVLNDPLYLSSDFFQALNPGQSNGMRVEDGIVYTANGSRILVTAQTAFATSEGEKNILLYHVLTRFTDNWNQAHPRHATSYFGTFDIAAANAIQVKKDTRLTLIITIAAILFILVFYYRKILIPVYFILPALFGALFAAGITGFFRPGVSAISLATSAVLSGIIIDYSFHFFTHLRHTRSISETLHEITGPLLTGSSTTILALAALSFANSGILQDFGIFAALGLSGAAFFTLIGLPVILQLLHFNYNNIPEPVKIRLPKAGKKLRAVMLALIAILTTVFLYTSRYTQFDSDPDHLSFHPDELKYKELELSGLDPAREKRIYAFASAPQPEAQRLNFALYETLLELKRQGKISSYVSAAPLYIPSSLKEARAQRWQQFWNDRKARVFETLDDAANRQGFSPGAFAGFKQWLSNPVPDAAVDEAGLPALLGLSDLVNETPQQTTYITPVVVPHEHHEAVKSMLAAVPGIAVFDRSETAGALLASVKDDFNYTLLVSASIVFFTLLIIYGRIEIALLAFMPMVISWIWILGIAALAGIKFNFVNVVISTFIFGLGDDFSIFVTEGLLHHYKFRRNNLESYTSAIVLSAAATMIGTGVLFFAGHPAIHSVSAISVLGIACILLFSLFVQPVLFGLFVENRIRSGKGPVTLFNLVCSVITISYFVTGCLLFYPILLVLYLLPVKRQHKAAALNTLISAFARSVLYLGVHVKKNIEGRENLHWNKPAILIANHASFLDILLVIMLNRKVIIMVKDWVYRSPLFGFAVRMAGYLYSEDDPQQNLDKLAQRLSEGYSLVVFPEGSRSETGELKRFHKGAFYLAQTLGTDIIPVMIHGAADVSPRNEYMVKQGTLSMRVLPRIGAADTSWGSTYQERAKRISSCFKTQYAAFKDEKETPAYLWKKVFANYVFKGPLLEWYGRIKWAFEAQNYRLYHKLLGNRKHITDLGCGYGYFDLYLHYKDRSRIITAIDYDEQKIAVAANVYNKTGNLSFLHADIAQYMFPAAQDAFLLLDVLHYLPAATQQLVLQKCVQALNPGGILLIRDGITDRAEQHRTTQKTELWSTTIMGFNKKDRAFHFFDAAFITRFAAENNLDVQLVEQSEKTSNVLFILTKQQHGTDRQGI